MRFDEVYVCKECGVETPEDRRPWWNNKMCPDCFEERRSLLGRKQYLRCLRVKILYMLYQAVRLELYRLRREREYRECPRSVPELRHWSTPLYSMHKIQKRVEIHQYVENILLGGCTKCGSEWKLKGVCDGPDMDGPTYYVYCHNCDSGFTLDYDRGGAICIA